MDARLRIGWERERTADGRALAGGRHSRSIPVAVALGAVLVCLADTLGRYVIAPSEIAAGLVTAIIGAPYFVWLLHRSRTR